MNTGAANEDDKEKMEVCAAMLRKKIEGVDSLRYLLTQEEYLSRFLYSSEFDVDKAFSWLKGHHDHLQVCPQFYTKCGPLDIKPLIERQISSVLPNFDREGRALILFKPANINTDNTSLMQLAELDAIWYEYILLNEPKIAGRGLCYIIDVKNHSYGFIKMFHIKNLKMCMRKIANIPFKEMVIHVVNKSFPIQMLHKIAMPMMPESSRRQVKFHFNNWQSLHQHVDPKYLPKEYGGTKEIDYSSIYRNLYEKHEKIVQRFKSVRNNKIN